MRTMIELTEEEHLKLTIIANDYNELRKDYDCMREAHRESEITCHRLEEELKAVELKYESLTQKHRKAAVMISEYKHALRSYSLKHASFLIIRDDLSNRIAKLERKVKKLKKYKKIVMGLARR